MNLTVPEWVAKGRNKSVRAERELLAADLTSLTGDKYIPEDGENKEIVSLMADVPAINSDDLEHAVNCQYVLNTKSSPSYIDQDEETRRKKLRAFVLKDKAVHLCEETVYSKTKKWMDRTVISSIKKEKFIRMVAIFAIKKSADEEVWDKIHYMFDKRTMLAGNKQFDERHLEHYFDKIEEDKAAGHEAYEIYDMWHRKYARHYAQNSGQIMTLIKTSILKGIKPSNCSQALEVLGKKTAPVTSNSLQYALMEVEQLNRQKEKAGANSDMDFDRDRFANIDDNVRYTGTTQWGDEEE